VVQPVTTSNAEQAAITAPTKSRRLMDAAFR